jgi:hypothetical protein
MAVAYLRQYYVDLGIDGLLLASATLEAPAGIVDIGAFAGLVAARSALERFLG